MKLHPGLAIIILIVSMIVLGCSTLSSNQKNSSILYSNYTSHDYNYSIEYPVNWTFEEHKMEKYGPINKVIFYPSMNNKTLGNDTYFSIIIERISGNIIDYRFAAILDIYRQERPDLEIQNWSNATLGGYYADVFTYRIRDTNIKGIEVYTLKSGKAYRLEFQAHDEYYVGHQNDVQHMIESFKFT